MGARRGCELVSCILELYHVRGSCVRATRGAEPKANGQVSHLASATPAGPGVASICFGQMQFSDKSKSQQDMCEPPFL